MTARLDLEALERLAAEATPGPWTAEPQKTDTFITAANGTPVGMVWGCRDDEPRASAALIAVARSALPALVARLRAADAALRQCVEALEWNQQNAKAFTGGDERRHATALAEAKRVLG